ncbi:MAG: cation-translocating P-type ATPase [Candidatus Promineifilaceae bacterium]|nr:cation-translocating P-type ATPase [Candidatus Promineifilaceae bacterium]
MSDWYQQTAEEVIAALETDPEEGLSSSEARRRLEEVGPNELEERGMKSPWRILWEQFTEVMVVILIIASIISLGLGEYTDAIAIMAIVVLNAALGYSQEYRAEQAIAALKKMAVPTVRVRRDGQITEISAREVVPGDIMFLEAGNKVSADGRLLESANLKVQEAALTGESEAVGKKAEMVGEEDLPLGDRKNSVYMGTLVTYGRGTVVVTETGMRTELGKIADMIQEVEREPTPLQKRLADLGRTLAYAAMGIIALVVVLGLLRGESLRELVLTGIAMAVAAVPEGLPAVVTITLALGSQRMLKRRALIRKLPAVETLGSVTTICSDKTGTLTENRMTVTVLDVAGEKRSVDALLERGVPVWRSDADAATDLKPEERSLVLLVKVMALANDAVLQPAEDEEGREWRAVGDPTEGALVVAAAELGLQKEDLEERWPRVAEVPFTSERKRMTTVHETKVPEGETTAPWRAAPYVAFSKGAVDSLLEICDQVWVGDKAVPLDEEMVQRITRANEEMAQNGQRVLSGAFRPLDALPDEEDVETLEQDLTFVGLIGMLDPPRPEVHEAVAKCRTAGIRPVMITGDHPLTARQIARELKIAENGSPTLTGPDLAKMSSEDLERQVEDVPVYARVSPEHKLNIVTAFQTKGQIVAMTGDGVNDAPALKKADIGVAMGITGTDVSKEAADMVLLDDNFATIVSAVEEGRVIFDNIRKFIKYTLSSNTGELWVMLVAPFLGMPLPLLPLQILWINLVTDGLPGLALAVEPAEKGVMEREPFRPKESIFSRGLGWQIIWVGILMGIVSLLMGFWYWRQDAQGHWNTMVFTTLTLAQMGNALALRTNRESLFQVGLLSNKAMLGAVSLTFVLQLAVIYVPFLQDIFQTSALSLRELVISLLASSVIFVAVELDKWRRRRQNPLA